MPKKLSTLPNEDSKCAICDDGECENSNAIVFCDGCNLAVHQGTLRRRPSCASFAEPDLLQTATECRTSPRVSGSAASAPSRPTSPSCVLPTHRPSAELTLPSQICVLCPNSYGAFKQTTNAQWAHLLCAIWIPDTGVSNTVYMEQIGRAHV